MKKKRPPIVTILGHVDHGKTTLLDAIRKTKVAAREAGGITQSIGASKVKTSEGEITFIDTPGHAAFSQMRARGTRLADIVVLVVAADSGVKPQTVEALDYIQTSKTPFIVAFTKTDLPSSDVDAARSQLEERGVLFEGRGGDVPEVSLSVKKNRGVGELLEIIHLVSEVNEIKVSPKEFLDVVVVEVNKDKRGVLVLAVVRNGTLKQGEEIITDDVSAKVRGIFDENGKPIKEAGPGDPVLILGFSKLPAVGSTMISGRAEAKTKKFEKSKQAPSEVGEGELAVVVKTTSSGALEAIISDLPKRVTVVGSSVGDVTESDVFFAKSSDARIVTFESKVSKSVAKLAETEGVEVESFNVIYELVKKLEELLEEGTKKTLGKAEVLASFPFDKKRIAGCKVIEGKIRKDDALILLKEGKEIGKAEISSMKRGKQTILEAKSGEECGILFVPQLDFGVGDMLVSVESK